MLTDTKGFTVSRKLDKMGRLCSDTAELEVERHFRDARVLGIGGGTTEIIGKMLGLWL
ncbi:hypothetical protein HND73_02735 [Rhodococcus ruber]|uniref:Acyl-CoA dehydrogenase/oxidase C-terminal domain-containing protein n=1 Tax=Rhodococcus ruber TaxID=1830 RepID=A0A098BRH3_9NOCA|nr:hypothetical protein [Rhodococcus ruber]CDZ91294.1 hypothetical protein RHRU231_820064 [Rhodococcus ruber]